MWSGCVTVLNCKIGHYNQLQFLTKMNKNYRINLHHKEDTLIHGLVLYSTRIILKQEHLYFQACYAK